MQACIARRLVALVPTLLFVSLIVFVSMRLIPGDVIDLMLAQRDIATGQDRARIEAARALLRPKAYLSILIATALEGGHDVEAVELRKPPGKKAYVFKIKLDDINPLLYVKLQLGAGNVIGRSFHYSKLDKQD